MKQFSLKHYVYIGCFLLLGLLLFKDPFSERSLIPNFEPFPDALYYVASAKNFILGFGFVIIRENRILIPSIPPLYPFILSPIFIFIHDPRAFYFMNVILSFVSFSFFYLILLKLIKNKLILAFVLILYVTNYFIYWFPSLVMAENMTLTLFLGVLLILLSKVSIKNIILFPILCVSFYGVKYASIPLTIAFLFVYLVKLITLTVKKDLNKSGVIIFISATFVAATTFLLYEYLARGINPFASILRFSSVAAPISHSVGSKSPWFSIAYSKVNMVHYVNALTGGSERFLWDFTPLVPNFVALGSFLGLILGLFQRSFRFICFTFLLIILSNVMFMSTFYSADMRYIYQLIPVLLLGFGIFLEIYLEKYSKGVLGMFLLLVVILLFTYYGATNAIRIKSQISLNLRYAETPWYYISVLKANEFFSSDKISQGKKPILISALPPYFVDFYSNGNYTLLPLSYDQEFSSSRELVWGFNDYSDLPKLYAHYLNNGFNVYVSRYGLGNEGYTNRDFQVIMSQFETELVIKGCYEQCNIYKLISKKKVD